MQEVWLSECGGKEPKECGVMMWQKLQLGEKSVGEVVLAATDEEAKERCMEVYREEKS